jgi:hypothetical protein
MAKINKKNNFLILPFQSTSTSIVFLDTSYQKLGTGLGSSAYGYKSEVDSQGNFYVVGQFTSAGGNPVKNIAKWDGNQWSEVGGGTNGYILAIFIDTNDDIYVGGGFNRCDPSGANVTVNNLAKWNGSSWTSVGGGVNGDVFAISKRGIDYLVGGSFTSVGSGGTLLSTVNFSSWNGTSWFDYNGGVGNYLAGNIVRDIEVLQNKIYLCGRFITTTTISANNVVMWDGSWNSLGTGASNGINNDTGSITSNGINTLYFGGGFSSAGGISTNNGLAVYNINTNTWSVLPNNGGSPSSIDVEYNLATNYLYVSTSNLIRQYNDTYGWSILASGFNAIPDEITIKSNGISLYITGAFTQISGETYNYVANILPRTESITTTRTSYLLLPRKNNRRFF